MNMKRMILLLMVLVLTRQTSAQTCDEWFHQKKTQIRYLLQQIGANGVYIEYLQKGYKIAESGLNTINNIKHGDFNLHNDFFNSLGEVNPRVKDLAEVADIIAMQVQIIKQARSAVQHIRSCDQFTSAEVTYLQNVFNHLLDECSKDINELMMVTTSSETQMTDDERIKRIDRIYAGMQDRLSFCKAFSTDAAMLALERSREATEVIVGKRLSGVP